MDKASLGSLEFFKESRNLFSSFFDMVEKSHNARVLGSHTIFGGGGVVVVAFGFRQNKS